MKIVSKTKASNIIIAKDEQTAVYDFVKALKVTDVSYKEIKVTVRKSFDYYFYELVVGSRGIIIAMRTNRNQIDILDLNTLEAIRKIDWLYDKSCCREKSVISEDEKYIYSISYTDNDQNTSFITRLDLDTYEEELIVELRGKYIFDIQYWKEKNDYLIAGIQFYEEEKESEVVGEYEVFLLNQLNKKYIFKDMAKSPYAKLELIGIAETQEILYWHADYEGECICNLNTGERLIALPNNPQVAFSENGKYIAYATCDREKVYLNVYSYEKREVVDRIQFLIKGCSLVGAMLGFRGNDKYLIFDFHSAMYLLEIELQ